jgi:hypothetical protein
MLLRQGMTNRRRVLMNTSAAAIKLEPGSRAKVLMAASISASSYTGDAESSTASDAEAAPNSRRKTV